MFQSLGRDSVHSSRIYTDDSEHATIVSIPRSGFCSFKPGAVGVVDVGGKTFQSLGRDSVHSSLHSRRVEDTARAVSIPRSGFCSFKPFAHISPRQAPPCFNPSVGILFIQASSLRPSHKGRREFQSLGRDSVHSSRMESAVTEVDMLVSIPRSGFCSFKPHQCHRHEYRYCSFNPSVGILFIQASRSPPAGADRTGVSIPRSGFCSFKLVALSPTCFALFRFQSLGRDSVHSSSVAACNATVNRSFQSLGRDSVHSSWNAVTSKPRSGLVSIPRSGFCSFKLIHRWEQVWFPAVSIPRSGFCSFKLLSRDPGAAGDDRFNPSVGILFIQATHLTQKPPGPEEFQSLGRDSVHSSCR